MAIFLEVGNKNIKQRLLRCGIHVVLLLGVLGIIFPLLIVMGQTISNDFDLIDNSIVPSYLKNTKTLMLKYVYSFSKRVNYLASRYNQNWSSFSMMRNDKSFYDQLGKSITLEGFDSTNYREVLSDYKQFKQTLPSFTFLAKRFEIEDYFYPYLRDKYTKAARVWRKKYTKYNQADLPEWFIKLYPNDNARKKVINNSESLGLALMNNELKTTYSSYFAVEVMKPSNLLVPFWRDGDSPKKKLWSEFKQSLPAQQKMVVTSDTYWHHYLKLKYGSINKLNSKWGTALSSIYECHFSFTPPINTIIRKDWNEFILYRWPRNMIHLKKSCKDKWQKYILRRFTQIYKNKQLLLQKLDRLFDKKNLTVANIPFVAERPAGDKLSRYWNEFISSGCITSCDLELLAPELLFHKYLYTKYSKESSSTNCLASINKQWKTKFSNISKIPLAYRLEDYVAVKFNSWKLRWNFLTESYKRVIQNLRGRGRAVQNTFILVFFAVLAALTINPIAAYSLSRFPMKNTHKILLFFLATMAFPTEVTMIPNFLLLRDFGLLNTYAALILPGMANGFSIFLLKGFFDSLPEELFQAAEIDGASEFRIFLCVAAPLVLPILAYIGLGTFVLTYGSFMWALVICPNQDMWTLMVWIYDFQTRNPGNNYIMAATVIASIPSLLVFLFANKVIMKGIVVPSLK